MSALSSSLAIVMFVGAARSDATAAQRIRLKDEAIPLLRDESLSMAEAYRACMEKVIEIMGDDWTIKPEWQAWIDPLLGDHPQAR